jgi:3D (Asp-Asp-Asp) domain-containing protein
MLLSRSLQRRLVVLAGAALGFVMLYESPILDSEYLSHALRRGGDDPVAAPGIPDPEDVASPAPGVRLRFRATAYCKGTTTASGTAIRTGIAAADPALLPVGSVIQVESLGPRYDGIYTIMDTGPKVRGRQIDIYMWNCNEALVFGRRTLTINVLRLGWNPRVSTPERVAPEFQRRERDLETRPPATPAPAPDAGSKPDAPAPGTTPAPSGDTPPDDAPPAQPAGNAPVPQTPDASGTPGETHEGEPPPR